MIFEKRWYSTMKVLLDIMWSVILSIHHDPRLERVTSISCTDLKLRQPVK